MQQKVTLCKPFIITLKSHLSAISVFVKVYFICFSIKHKPTFNQKKSLGHGLCFFSCRTLETFLHAWTIPGSLLQICANIQHSLCPRMTQYLYCCSLPNIWTYQQWRLEIFSTEMLSLLLLLLLLLIMPYWWVACVHTDCVGLYTGIFSTLQP